MSLGIIAVIPAWNEAPPIGGIVAKTRARVDEVIVIDDGSADDTAAVAERRARKYSATNKTRGRGARLSPAWIT